MYASRACVAKQKGSGKIAARTKLQRDSAWRQIRNMERIGCQGGWSYLLKIATSHVTLQCAVATPRERQVTQRVEGRAFESPIQLSSDAEIGGGGNRVPVDELPLATAKARVRSVFSFMNCILDSTGSLMIPNKVQRTDITCLHYAQTVIPFDPSVGKQLRVPLALLKNPKVRGYT